MRFWTNLFADWIAPSAAHYLRKRARIGARRRCCENGRIVEDDTPAELAARPGSRYRAMLDAEQEVRRGLWQGAEWRRLWIEEGVLKESQPGS